MKTSTDWHDALAALVCNTEEDSLNNQDNNRELEKKSPVMHQKLRFDIERKGRGGKTATIISGFTCPDEEITRIAAELKRRLGVGGSARGGEILIQGDRRKETEKILKELGIL